MLKYKFISFDSIYFAFIKYFKPPVIDLHIIKKNAEN